MKTLAYKWGLNTSVPDVMEEKRGTTDLLESTEKWKSNLNTPDEGSEGETSHFMPVA